MRLGFQRRPGRSGFTLLELLVVVSIIGVLASLLVPALGGATSQARANVCRGNTRQMGMIFVTEWPRGRGANVASALGIEDGRFDSGVDRGSWLCPEAPAPLGFGTDQASVEREFSAGAILLGSVNRAWGWVPRSKLRIACSYSFNEWLFEELDDEFVNPFTFAQRPQGRVFRVEERISRPSMTPVLGDGLLPVASITSGDLSFIRRGAPVDGAFRIDLAQRNRPGFGIPGKAMDFLIARHGAGPRPAPEAWDVGRPLPGAINITFFDGSSRLVPLEELWGLQWGVGGRTRRDLMGIQ